MNLTYLTGKNTSAENATPAQIMLKDASFCYYSEANKHESLNAAKVKEITGLETLAGRRLHQDLINFKPKCHHLVTTNYDFDISDTDHGIWRRISYVPLKMRFVNMAFEEFDPTDPYQRIGDDSVEKWPEDPEMVGRYLGFTVWYHYWLHKKYKGKVKAVPHPHIQYETEKFRRRQDAMAEFLAQRFVKCADEEEQHSMIEETLKYSAWYKINKGVDIPIKGLTDSFQNSQIGKYIKTTSRGVFLQGYRFLSQGEKLAEGEEYFMKNVFSIEMPADNFGVKSETPEEYYERICKEYDSCKYIFNGEGSYNIDPTSVPEMVWKDDINAEIVEESKNIKTMSRGDNLANETVVGGRILPNGIVLRALEEPVINDKTDIDIESMEGFLPSDDDSDMDNIDIPGYESMDD